MKLSFQVLDITKQVYLVSIDNEKQIVFSCPF